MKPVSWPVFTMTDSRRECKELKVLVSIDEKPVHMELDTGARCLLCQKMFGETCCRQNQYESPTLHYEVIPGTKFR